MNIVFKVHLKFYKRKISTIILNLKMFQGQHRPFIFYTSQEIFMSLPRFTGSQEKYIALCNATSAAMQPKPSIDLWMPPKKVNVQNSN